MDPVQRAIDALEVAQLPRGGRIEPVGITALRAAHDDIADIGGHAFPVDPLEEAALVRN